MTAMIYEQKINTHSDKIEKIKIEKNLQRYTNNEICVSFRQKNKKWNHSLLDIDNDS